MAELIENTPRGLYCSDADLYIDPWSPVTRAVVTHAHSDHARFGSDHYLCHPLTAPVLRLRLGPFIQVDTVEYGETVTVNGATVSLHPAGHIPGSSQVRIERGGEVWVISGDYKLEDDGLSAPFEPIRCSTFVTECTFGMPIYNWQPQREIFDDLNQWWRSSSELGVNCLVTAYSLGKAQRILNAIDPSIGPVLLHGAVSNVNDALAEVGISFPFAKKFYARDKKEELCGALIIAPPSVIGSPWVRNFAPCVIGAASGWMALRGIRRRRGVERGFVLSDHADFSGLLKAVHATEAPRIFATHGYKAPFVRYLKELGFEAYDLDTEFTGEILEEREEAPGA